MLKTRLSMLTAAVTVLLFNGCSTDDKVSEFNKPALYWYQKIGESISRSNMDKADSYYISLKSEHMRSPMMPTAIMILANAHMNDEKYLLAKYYFDEYNKRFGESRTREYTEFLKLKASFHGVKDIYKDQKLIMDTIKDANTYLMRYPDSRFEPLVQTVKIRLQMSQYLLNENIASLYERTGKPEAAKVYKAKNKHSVIEMHDITPPEKGFVGAIFDSI